MDLGVASRTDAEILADAANTLTLGDVSAITSDLTLPTDLGNDVTISWISNNAAVISNNGVVTRPEAGQPNAEVTLTATLTKGNKTATKTFNIIVVAKVDAPQNQIVLQENFDNIFTWTDASLDGTGLFTTALRKFVSGFSGGIQKGDKAITILASGTNTTNLDMKLSLLNASNITLSFDWSKVENPSTTPTTTP
jgi:hypothetical protein